MIEFIIERIWQCDQHYVNTRSKGRKLGLNTYCVLGVKHPYLSKTSRHSVGEVFDTTIVVM